MTTRLDNRQSRQRSILDQLSNSTDLRLDNILNLINDELQMPLRMRASSTPNLVLNIDSIKVSTSDSGEGHGRNRTLPPISGIAPSFSLGTVTLSGTGATGVATPSAGSPLNFVMAANQYIRIGACLATDGSLFLTAGTAGASLSAATVPTTVSGTYPIGNFVVRTNSSNVIQNILNTDIYQYVGSSGSGGGGLSATSQTLTYGYSSQDITGLNFDYASNRAAKIEYSVLKTFNTQPSSGLQEEDLHGIIKSDLGFNNSVNSIAVQSDGKILVGGLFTSYAGTVNRNRLVRLNSNGTLDTTFCTNAVDGPKFNNSVNSIAVQSDGKILVGGDFTGYAGTTNRNYLVRLNSDGTLDTTFCTNAVDGAKFNNIIRAIAVQSDGKILVGGDFTAYAGTANRNRLVRLNSDGTLDTTFCTNAVDGAKFNNTIHSIAVQSDGKILVGGDFTNYAGTANRNYLIRLNSNGTLDTTFCTNAVDGAKFNNTIRAIAVQSDGKILVGGLFTSYAGTANRNYLIRLNSDGTLDTTFCTNAVDGAKFNSIVYSIAVQSDGKILVGGNFTSYAGTANRNYLVRLNSDGTLDTTFCTNAVDGGKFNSAVYSIAVQADSKILVGGSFLKNSTVTSRFTVIKSDGKFANAFMAGLLGNNLGLDYDSQIQSTVVQSDGKILVGGNFTNYAGTANRNYLIRLNSDGTTDTTFCTNAVDGDKFNNSVNSIIIQSDGKILVGGNFINYAGTANRNRLVRLNTDGTLDTTFCTNAVDGNKFNNSVNSIIIQSDGKILVGGEFIDYGLTTGRNRLVRLNSDGTTDTTFCANAVDVNKFQGVIYFVTTQNDGKILVGGNFTNYAGTANRNYLIRLNSDGTTDTTFCTNAVDGNKFNNSVNSIIIQSDGKILVGGNFTSYAGTIDRNRLIRLNSDGTTDTTFCTNAVDGDKFNNSVNSIIIQSDGKILVGGNFINYAGTANRNRLVRLNTDGTLDTTFCTNAVDGNKFNNVVSSIATQSDRKILVSGYFYNYNGAVFKNGIVRLNSDGTSSIRNSAIAFGNFNNTINSIAVQSDGKILVGGDFTGYAGTTNRNYLVRLNSDGTLDTTFCTNAVDGAKFNNTIRAIAVQSDGKILVGGLFTSYAGTANRNYLVRLNSDGTLDTTFCTNAVDGAKFNNIIRAIAVQSDGKILVGGYFTNYAGTIDRNRLIRLNSDGTTDTTFCTNAVDGAKFNSIVNSIIIQSDGKILVGGYFYSYGGIFGREYLVRLNSDGTLDTTFCTNAVDGAKFNNTIHSIAVQSDGKILVGGEFIDYDVTTDRNYVVRLNSDGTLDTTFCTNAVDGGKFNSAVLYIAVQSDGKILVSGFFTNYAGTANRVCLVRLNSDGTLDTTFCTNAVDGAKFNSTVYSIAVQSDGKILVGGLFTNYAGYTGYSYLSVLDNVIVDDKIEQGSFSVRYSSKNMWTVDGRTYNGDDTKTAFSIAYNGQVKYTSLYDTYTPSTYQLKWISISL